MGRPGIGTQPEGRPAAGSAARVTVLLPVRNGAATVGAALESLSAQTLANFDVVVVDDGSTDDTAAIVRAWIGRFGAGPAPTEAATHCANAARQARPPSPLARRGRLIQTPPDGIVPALQRGLAEVRTPYTARMDGDDVSRPERLAAQLAHLEKHPEMAGCGTQVRLVPPSAVTERATQYANWLNGLTGWSAVKRDIFVECPLAHPTFMFRTSVLRGLGGYRDRGWPEDYDLLLRLWRAGHRFAALPRVLLDWTESEGRTSRTHPAYSQGALRRCRVHHLRRSLLAGRRGVVVWGAGPTGKALAKEFGAQGVPILGFVDVDPRKIGQEIHGVPVRASADVGDFPQALHVGGVARAEGRRQVRKAAAAAGLEDGADFVAMA